jgi:hypothetical protein
MKLDMLVLSVLMFCVACGRASDPKVDLRNDLLGDASTDPNCKKGQCQPIDFSLTNGNGEALENAVAQGVVGQPVEWIVKVKTAAKSQRIKIAVIQAPQWMQKKSSSEPGSIVLMGTPTEFVSKSNVIILARDVAQCAAMESSAKDCLSPDKAFEAYDRKINFMFAVSGGSSDNNGGNGGNSTGGGQPNNVTPTPPNENCQKNGGILGSIAGKIPFIGGLFNKGSGC